VGTTGCCRTCLGENDQTANPMWDDGLRYSRGGTRNPRPRHYEEWCVPPACRKTLAYNTAVRRDSRAAPRSIVPGLVPDGGFLPTPQAAQLRSLRYYLLGIDPTENPGSSPASATANSNTAANSVTACGKATCGASQILA
jgi:hypothetical protein